ncbi:MAG: molybdopterin cofactor-binding domain-containing protein [Bacteroidota bacterium]
MATSRRNFIKSTTGFVFVIGATGGLQLFSCRSREEKAKLARKIPLTPWVFLAENGDITIYNPASEMGQGSMTALPIVFAEEMDADWNKVKVEFSPQDSEKYGSPGWGNRKIQMTVGSRTVKTYYNILRQAGAQARYVLLNSAAEHWQLPIEELSTVPSLVVHEKSGKKIAYGDLVPLLKIPASIPEIAESDLKKPADFRLIGKDIPRTDIPEKINGLAKFSIDMRLPNTLFGVIERGKLHGAKPTLKNEETIRQMEGFIKFVFLDYGIGVIASTIERALAIKKALKIEWSEEKVTSFNSQDAYARYTKLANGKLERKEITRVGDFRKTFQSAAKTYTVDFKNDYVYHAQMEPLNGVAQMTVDEQSIEIWIGHQQSRNLQDVVAKAVNIDPKKVQINLCYLGGGLGRRSMTDYLIETALLAKAVPGQPVKMMWTREDDLQYGMYRPLSLQRLQACTDANGNLTGFSHTIVGDGDHLLASGIKNEFYSIPNQLAELQIVPEGIRLKHWRAVGHGPNKFAIEAMIDEVAMDQGRDAIDFRRNLMKDSPRALATLNKAAEMAKWNEPLLQGRAKGVAFLERSGTLSTGICEISLNRETGKIKVHHFWTANDCGTVVQPDNASAQIEGGIIMGLSSVLKEQLTIKDGKAEQSNFHDYQLLRMEEVPESIENYFIQSSEPPQGVGESGTPLVAGAIANAFAALTGKRLRQLPFTPERVLNALNS